MSSKNERQNRIKEILNSSVITSQEELVNVLNTEHVHITQATLSRDFAELGVIRTMTERGVRYVLDPNESGKQIQRLIGFEILSIECNEYMVVIRTLSGRAQGVGHYIDRLNKNEILGTVAGDDTVLIIPNSINNIQAVIRIVKSIIAISHNETTSVSADGEKGSQSPKNP